jgi:hypothetical protein
MFGRRRRPVLGAAAVGGAGYALGKRRANLEEDEAGNLEEGEAGNLEEDEAGEVEEVDEVDEVEAAAPAEEPGLGDDSIDALEKLGGLKERGILTQQEFDDQKARILDAP